MNIVTSNGKLTAVSVSAATTSTVAHKGGAGVTMVGGGTSSAPIIKVSNATATTSSSSTATGVGLLSPSPNMSVTSTGKRVAGSSRGNSNTAKDRATNKEKEAAARSKESKEISLKPDLRNIMQAFGDGTSPSEDSVQLMELILRQEMTAFIFLCDTAAYWGGYKVLGMRECIYTLRNDKPFLSRLFKYFIIKDQQQQKTICVNYHGQTKVVSTQGNYLGEIREILDDLDGSGELEKLLDQDNSFDGSGGKLDKAHQAESNTHRLISPKYINYVKARSISFARKLPQLQEWVSQYLHSEYKLSQNFMDILAFLIYDFVAQIVDLSFIIKRERTNGSNPLLKLYDPRGSNPDTCMSATLFLRKDEECNNVSEMLVLASELEAKRLKKVSTSNREVVSTKSVHCLSPSEIKEAYLRMQNSQAPSISFRTRAEKIKHFSFQY